MARYRQRRTRSGSFSQRSPKVCAIFRLFLPALIDLCKAQGVTPFFIGEAPSASAEREPDQGISALADRVIQTRILHLDRGTPPLGAPPRERPADTLNLGSQRADDADIHVGPDTALHPLRLEAFRSEVEARTLVIEAQRRAGSEPQAPHEVRVSRSANRPPTIEIAPLWEPHHGGG